MQTGKTYLIQFNDGDFVEASRLIGTLPIPFPAIIQRTVAVGIPVLKKFVKKWSHGVMATFT
jgi:hypothetical protein